MTRRQKVEELFLQQRKLRIKNKQLEGLRNKTNLGQSFQCIGLGKSKTEQQISRKESFNIDKYGEIPALTRKSVQQLTKLMGFYQQEKGQRNPNPSQKLLSRKKFLNLPVQLSQKNSFYKAKQSPRVKYNFLSKTPWPIIQKISIGSLHKKTSVQNSRREVQSERKSISGIEQVQIEKIKLKSFIPTPKLKSSPKKCFFFK